MNESEKIEALQAWKSETENNLNQLFLLIMGALVMFMQAGFAFLEAGAVRSKNVVNILIKNTLDCFCGALIYWVLGYGFAYGSKGDGTSTDAFIGSKYFFTIGLGENDVAGWFFQYTFAACAATIVSGAVAERTQFGSYIIYSSVITGFIYPVVSHWGWTSEGWLQSAAPWDGVGFVDFAGSGILHCTGGVAALMGAIIIGPRIGKFGQNGKIYHIPGHSVPITALGGFILFLGFFAFNGGSHLQIVSNKGDGAMVALIYMNTVLGGAGGAISCMLCNYFYAVIKGEEAFWSLLTCINGGLGGMVSMCAGCNNIHQERIFQCRLYMGTAFALGILGGFTVWWVSSLLKKLKIDDPLDAFAVHYGGGLCGILFTPVFMNDGIVHWTKCSDQGLAADEPCDYKPFQVWVWNLVGLIAITLWTGVLCALMFGSLHYFDLLRIDEDIEIRGLDIRKHGEPAYPTAAYGHGWDDEGHLIASFLGSAAGTPMMGKDNPAFKKQSETTS